MALLLHQQTHGERSDLIELVRSKSVNSKTIKPMAAWAHSAGGVYKGSNLARLLDHGGGLALEPTSFKDYFACLDMKK
jgi:hypothetical protein